MAEDVKQEPDNNLASEEKKNVKVVVKKKVRKTTAKKTSEKKEEEKEVEAKKDDSTAKKTTTRKRTPRKKSPAKTEDKQLELALEKPEEEAKPKKRTTRATKKKVVSTEVKEDKEIKEEDSTQKNEISNLKTEDLKPKKVTRKRVTKKKSVDDISDKNNKVEPLNLKTAKVENKVEVEKSDSKIEEKTKIDIKDTAEQQKSKVSTDETKTQETVSEENNSSKDNNQQNNNRKPNNRNNNNNNNRNNNNRNNRNNRNKSNKKYHEERIEEVNLDENPNAEKLFINDIYFMSFELLRKKGIALGLNKDSIYDYKRQEIITEVLRSHCIKGGALVVEGTLEVLPDGYGFLRSSSNSYISGAEDIYVSANIIRHNALKTGDLVYGQVKTPRDSERYYGLHKVLLINNDEILKAKTRPSFDSLTPIFPDERMRLENSSGDISTRLIDMFCPIGKGQRSLIVAPPRTGKTILMQKIANSISENYPEISLIVLLVDERPEEVTDMKEHVKGEVIASTFDEQATRHVQVAEMAIEKAKRLVEAGKDVVILLDSITRLARAYNQTVPASGKILSGGVDSNALHKPKRFFGAARNMQGGGSLTIIATALIETGSRMDEVIFEEFKGTGNNEIVLDRRLAERRIFPAINIKKSGTRKDELLIPQDEAKRIWIIRNAINDMDEVDQTPFLIDKMQKAKNNEAFFKFLNTTSAN